MGARAIPLDELDQFLHDAWIDPVDVREDRSGVRLAGVIEPVDLRLRGGRGYGVELVLPGASLQSVTDPAQVGPVEVMEVTYSREESELVVTWVTDARVLVRCSAEYALATISDEPMMRRRWGKWRPLPVDRRPSSC